MCQSLSRAYETCQFKMGPKSTGEIRLQSLLCLQVSQTHGRLWGINVRLAVPPNYYQDLDGADKDTAPMCKQCQGTCPKSCIVEEFIHYANIFNLTNCTVIEGNIEIRADNILQVCLGRIAMSFLGLHLLLFNGIFASCFLERRS